MRAARLHGVGDLRVEDVPDPSPGPGELLVRVEACGVCPTDVRKWRLGVEDGAYPFNPGHEWLGRVEAAGPDADGWVGRRVYGDTFGGYAELALVGTEPGAWSNGALELPPELPAEQAVFVEPLADCLHALLDQAELTAGAKAVVLGAGQMGLQLVAAATALGIRTLAVDPLDERLAVAESLGADATRAPEEWREGARAWAPGGLDAVVVSIGAAELVAPATEAVAPGGRVVLFAGFGDRADALLDLNVVHYREIAVVGSEWIGTPPNQRRERYAEALELIASGRVPVERLVTARCGFEGLAAAFEDQQALRGLKTVLVP